MCKITEELKEPVEIEGYKVVSRSLSTGKIFSPFTAMEYKVGKVKGKTTTTGPNKVEQRKLLICAAYTCDRNDDSFEPIMTGRTGVFITKPELRVFVKNYYGLGSDRYEAQLVKMKIRATHMGEFRGQATAIGDEILSIELLQKDT